MCSESVLTLVSVAVFRIYGQPFDGRCCYLRMGVRKTCRKQCLQEIELLAEREVREAKGPRTLKEKKKNIEHERARIINKITARSLKSSQKIRKENARDL